MNSEVKLFENVEFGKVRTIQDEQGEIWFALKDILSSLEYAEGYNPARAVQIVPDEWKGVHPMHTPSGTQEMITLSEQGLYFFLGRSDKPKALPYQKWIAGEVMPSIRKTGGYGLSTSKVQVDLAEAIFRAAKIEGNQLALALDRLHIRVTGISALQGAGIELVAPTQSQLFTPTQIGKAMEPPLSARKVNNLLELKGYQENVGGLWTPTNKGRAAGAVLMDTGKRHGNGVPIRQLKWPTAILADMKI